MTRQDLRGERLCLSLERWGPLGDTLARYDGRQVSVFGGIPGEEVVAEVIRDRREYIAATVVEVLSASVHRTAAPCMYFGACTGCQWQHIDYDYQLETKRRIVEEALATAGVDVSCVMPTLPAPEQYGYRNHARFTVGRRKGELGFVNRESRRFVVIDSCLLMDPWINGALGKLQGRCSETSQLSIRYGVNTGDYLIQPLLRSPDVGLPSGQKHYREELGQKEFRIAAGSFFQVNVRQAARMAELVREELQLTGQELLVDAYAGVGAFAAALAPYVAKVVAVEESPSAVKDARANADLLDNVHFLEGKTEEVLAQIEERPDRLILDPPRSGCHPKALAALVELAPERVVYVSCDPGTLGRDLATLCRGPFVVERVQPIDMFPQTHHIECVATLRLERGDGTRSSLHPSTLGLAHTGLVLASTSPRRNELLSLLDLEFQVVPPSASEEPGSHEKPEKLVERLALAKARSVAESTRTGLVVGGDSVVVLDGRVMGKPGDAAEAWEMLRSLRASQHVVISGVAVVNAEDGSSRVDSRTTTVVMRDYSDAEIEAYVASGEPMDKAGAYAVQDETFHPAARVEGCYANVMGLPLCTLVELLKDSGSDTVPPRVPEICANCGAGSG